MNTNKLLFISLLCFPILSHQAHAEFYITGQAGAYGAGSENNFIDNLFDNDDKLRGTARLGVGYFVNATTCFHLGFEGAFQSYEKQSFNNAYQYLYERKAVDILGVVDYTFSTKVNVFAKGGIASIWQNTDIDAPNDWYHSRDAFITPKAILGLGYNIHPTINLNLSLAHEFKKDNHEYYSRSVSSLLAGITYQFT